MHLFLFYQEQRRKSHLLRRQLLELTGTLNDPEVEGQTGVEMEVDVSQPDGVLASPLLSVVTEEEPVAATSQNFVASNIISGSPTTGSHLITGQIPNTSQVNCVVTSSGGIQQGNVSRRE